MPSSTLPEDRAPSAFRDNLKDQTAPTHPGAPREQLEACRALSSPPRAAPKMRVLPLSTTRHLTPIEERIKDLHESMNAVRDMQDQMREQDERHHQMTRRHPVKTVPKECARSRKHVRGLPPPS